MTKYFSRENPRTIPGIKTGDRKILLKKFFPLKLYLLRAYAAGIPKIKAIKVPKIDSCILIKKVFLNISILNILAIHFKENPFGGKVKDLSGPKDVNRIITNGAIKKKYTKNANIFNPLFDLFSLITP